MLKVMGLVLILTAAVGTGYSISRELSLREKNLRQYLMLIISLKGEIRYGNSSLAEAFQRTVPRLQGSFRELAEKLAKELGSVEGITLEQLLCGKHASCKPGIFCNSDKNDRRNLYWTVFSRYL